MPVLCEWNLAVDADRVLWGQGADPARVRARRPALVKIAEEVIEEGSPMLAPVVLYRRIGVESFRHETVSLAGGGKLQGPLVASQLAGSTELIVALCTVGEALSTYASNRFNDDPVRSLALDGLASASAEALAESACRRFEELAEADGLKVTMPLNPGMIGWPLDAGQAQLFALMDGGEIGVTLGAGGLMRPLKSLSLVVGIGRDLAPNGCTCDYCSMRDTCLFKKSGQEQHG
jgi:hypothetical protein